MLEPLWTCNLACLGCSEQRHAGRLEDRLPLEKRLDAAEDCGAPIVSMFGGGPAIADLESAHHAEVAEREGVPWLILRGASDDASESIPSFLDECREERSAVKVDVGDGPCRAPSLLHSGSPSAQASGPRLCRKPGGGPRGPGGEDRGVSRTRVRSTGRARSSETGDAAFRAMLTEFRDRHDRAVEEYLERKRGDVPGRAESRDLIDVLEDFVASGGKRLRPALTYFAYRAFGGRSDEVVLPLAMSTELPHTYLLIQDDIMGCIGDSGRAGKPGGLDLIEGKRTVLVHHALRASSTEGRRRLRRTLEDPGPGQGRIEDAQAVIRRSGALSHVRRMISRRLDRAEAAVEEAPVAEEARTFFAGLIHYLRGRER